MGGQHLEDHIAGPVQFIHAGSSSSAGGLIFVQLLFTDIKSYDFHVRLPVNVQSHMESHDAKS